MVQEISEKINWNIDNLNNNLLIDTLSDLLQDNLKFPLLISNYENSSISICKKRWWTCPSLSLNWVNIFYNNPLLREDTTKSIRESFWMWPISWNLSQEDQEKLWFNLQQHWFLRNVERDLLKNENGIVELEYTNNKSKESFKEFPFHFKVKQTIQIYKESAYFNLQITNLDEKVMPFAPWHHTYYQVNPEEKKEIELNNINISQEDKTVWINWEKTLQILENPWKIEIKIPWKPKYTIEYDKKFKNIWLWSEINKWFVCIEPVVTHGSNFKENALYIKPNETEEIKFHISL